MAHECDSQTDRQTDGWLLEMAGSNMDAHSISVQYGAGNKLEFCVDAIDEVELRIKHRLL